MTMKRSSWMKVIVLCCAVTLFSACEDDPNEPMGQGEVEFEITDAPIDDASVRSVVVTVADVKVDGRSLEGFTRQSVDLKAYQDGNTKLLGSGTMDARAYSNVTLVLDLDTDAQGNSPGCYVLDADNMKHKLKSTASGTLEVAANHSWTAMKDVKTNVVMDFDLRKSVRYSDDPSVKYSFVSASNLNSAVRVTTKQASGTIRGSYQDEANVDADMIIVHAYKKGTFNASTETQAEATDGIYFRNAVASAVVKDGFTGKQFTLAYLPEGEYELYFASYTEDTVSGRHSFDAMLQSETSVEGAVGNIVKVEAAVEINISASITGII